MSNQVALRQDETVLENVLVKGDLSKLTPKERADYYLAFCRSAGLNPLTKPMEYILLNGKLTLYALRNCTDQLRAIHKISVAEMTETERDGVCIVTCKVTNSEGRTDIAKGAVNIGGLKGEALANAIMKSETKAKRRATLSICGLSLLDETEVEDIPTAAKRENPHVNRAEDMVDVPAHDDPDRIPNGNPAIKSLPKKNSREDFAKWQQELHALTDEAAILKWLRDPSTADRVQTYPADWQEIARGLGKQHLAAVRMNRPSNGGGFLADLDKNLAAITDPVELQDVWEEIVLRLADLPTPDAEEAWGIFSKHEKRLEP